MKSAHNVVIDLIAVLTPKMWTTSIRSSVSLRSFFAQARPLSEHYSKNKQCLCLSVSAHHAVRDHAPRLSALALSSFLCGFSSHVSNVPQLEMSKQDDRGSEESANQTSVSRKKEKVWVLPTPLQILCCVLILIPYSFFPWLSSLPSPSDMTDHYRPVQFTATAFVIE